MSIIDHSFRSIGERSVPNPVEYEKSIYQKGLNFERPPFTFHTADWETEAGKVLSATSKGYVTGNAGTGETTKKNLEAFKKWSIVPKRLVKYEGLPDLSTKLFGQHFQFPIAAAPVGVQRELLPYRQRPQTIKSIFDMVQAYSIQMEKWLLQLQLQRTM